MLYLTFGDGPGGVLYSQAIDVCKFIRAKFGVRIRMVFFISIRGFFVNRKKFKTVAPGCLVLPMFPKINTWRWNGITLAIVCVLTGRKCIMSRGVLATNLALGMRKFHLAKKVCYDGRGAYDAEWQEYDVSDSNPLKNVIHALESKAVNNSDFRLAVSNQLIQYWIKRFHYQLQNHVVIPCLLNSDFKLPEISNKNIHEQRKQLGYNDDDMLLIYSGSSAGWQSFSMLEDFLTPLLKNNSNHKVLFLSPGDAKIDSLKMKFPHQIQSLWVNHNEVQNILMAGDYGILIREHSVTNQVASPTKFAEYLSAGLNVLISENLGDYSAFVNEHQCGIVVNEKHPLTFLEKTSVATRQKNMKLVEKYFTKQSQVDMYKSIIEALQ